MTQSMSLTLTDAQVKRRGKSILGPVSLELPASCFTIVIGPNGAGKTTLLKALNRLIDLDDEVLRHRRDTWQPESRQAGCVLRKYARLVSCASRGAITDSGD